MSNCKLYLDNQIRTFSPGAPIKGRLECYLTDTITVRGIKVRLQCKEHNEWTEQETYIDTSDNNKVKTKQVYYSGNNYIIRKDYMLFGSADGLFDLSSGKHVYPFSFRLPQDIPSTYDGPYGSISYKLKGIVDRPLRFDYEDTCYFKVNAPIDINRLPRRLQQPASYSDDKTVCDWCCQGGNITMDVKLPKSAFTPGQTINLTVDVCNMSNTSVEQLNVTLEKTLTYRVTSPSNHSKENNVTMATLHQHGVGAHGQYTYNLDFIIPEYIFIPNFAKCTLFEVAYLLQVSCQMPTCTLDLDIDIWDIVMGHIPWRPDLPPSYSSGPSSDIPSGGKRPSASSLLPSAPVDTTRPSAPLKEEPPPSYDEVQSASTSNQQEEKT